jgi:protein-tyrosine-phosphatase
LFAQTGAPADPTAVAAARELGISLDHHGSAPLTSEMVDRDVIFVMDDL